jgi:F1F0 ATPase subunit 2
MTTTDVLYLVLAFTAGLGLAGLHFAGLWLTISRLPQSKHPGLLMIVSLIIRLGITLTAIYFVMGGHWQRLLACVAGFLIGRLVCVRIWGQGGQGKTQEKARDLNDHTANAEAVAHGHHS